MSKQIVLLGGGHSQVEVLRQFAERPVADAEVTLVTRDVLAPYSGMLPGLVAGHYTYRQCHIDVGALAKAARARVVHVPAVGLDAGARELKLEGGERIPYDVLSINIGSRPTMEGVPGAAEHALPVKPVDGFLEGLERIEEDMRETRPSFRIVIVGGGAGGVELALSLRHRFRSHPMPPDIRVVHAGDEVLDGHNPKVRRRLRRALDYGDVEVSLGARVASVEAGAVLTEQGERIPFEALIWTTHAAPARWLAASGLALDDRGFVSVRKTLQSVSHPEVFAAGDVATVADAPRPKSGVFAVRAGEYLAENVRRFAQGDSLREWQAQRRFLSLISTGDPYAVASWGPWSAEGRWVWWWKDRIDRAFMAKYGTM